MGHELLEFLASFRINKILYLLCFCRSWLDKDIELNNDKVRRKLFKFIKAVSDTVFDMINAVYYDKPLILIQ